MKISNTVTQSVLRSSVKISTKSDVLSLETASLEEAFLRRRRFGISVRKDGQYLKKWFLPLSSTSHVLSLVPGIFCPALLRAGVDLHP